MKSSKGYPTPKRWYPKNPEKYMGDSENIWVRSSWERKVLAWLDTNPNVIGYCSEEIKIPYVSPVDSKYHTYYPDVLAKIKTSNSNVVTYLIEIKPYSQTIPPKVKKNITKSYINEVYTWGVNSAKFKAAEEYCKRKGWEFKILTEKEIFANK